MIRTFRNAAVSLAVAGLVVAQPAMAVRSSDSLPTTGAKLTVPARLGSKASTAEDLHGTNGFVIGAITLTVLVALLLAATVGHHDGDNNPDGRSPG